MQRRVGLANDVGLQEVGGKWGLRQYLYLTLPDYPHTCIIRQIGTFENIGLLDPHLVLLTVLSFFAFSSLVLRHLLLRRHALSSDLHLVPNTPCRTNPPHHSSRQRAHLLCTI